MIYDPYHNFLFLKNGRAGSTFAELVIQQYCSSKALFTANDRIVGDNAWPSKNNWARLTEQNGILFRPDIRAHETWDGFTSKISHEPNIIVFTVFREPISRVLSWYNWECQFWGYNKTIHHFIYDRWTRWENNSMFEGLDGQALIRRSLTYPIKPGDIEFKLRNFSLDIPATSIYVPDEPIHQTSKQFATKSQLNQEDFNFIRLHCKLESSLFYETPTSVL